MILYLVNKHHSNHSYNVQIIPNPCSFSPFLKEYSGNLIAYAIMRILSNFSNKNFGTRHKDRISRDYAFNEYAFNGVLLYHPLQPHKLLYPSNFPI